jgi:hypothetical protein
MQADHKLLTEFAYIRDTIVGISTVYTVVSPIRGWIQCQLALGPNRPPNEWALGKSFLGIKRQESDDQSSPSTDDVKNEWSYTSTPSVSFDELHSDFSLCT